MDVDVIVGTHRARASSRVAGTALPCGESGANLVAREDEIVYSPGHALPAGLGHQLAYIPMCIIYIYIYIYMRVCICAYIHVHMYGDAPRLQDSESTHPRTNVFRVYTWVYWQLGARPLNLRCVVGLCVYRC